jgi:ribosome-binding factor A
MDQHRSKRVSEAIREELSEIIVYEMSDPRISLVDVTEVLVTPDMRHARVRLHLAGDETGREGTLSALGGARHFLRRELASRLRLADLETESSSRFEHLLKRARKGRAKNAGEERKSSLE